MAIRMEQLNGIDTPAMVIDLDIVRGNIARFQSYADENGLKVRPHIKTHKLPMMAEWQLDAGAVGVTCQKTSEAEAMIAGSGKIRDVLLTYNIVGVQKLERLKALARKVKLAVTADGAEVIDGLSAAFTGEPAPLTVFVECDTGANRCGAGTPEKTEALVVRIINSPGLAFGGLMTYPPAGEEAAVESFMRETIERLASRGISVPVVTSGGTPSMMQAAKAPSVTEYRPGTYIYNDRSLVMRGACGWEDCAATVLTTVVSVPAANRAIIDAGSKTLTSDLFGLTGYGHVQGRDDIAIDQLSEEHGRLVSSGPIGLHVGDRLRIVPNHVCVTINMMDIVHLIENGRARPVTVTARGQVL